MRRTFLKVLLALFLVYCSSSSLLPATNLLLAVSSNSTVTFSPIPIPTLTLTTTPKPIMVWQGPGTVVCPILLYHHIETPHMSSKYYVTPENFRAQLQILKDWGYSTIPASLLGRAIREGAYLPERPIVLTLDDGNLDIYTNAFPIMQEFGYIGVVYITGHALHAEGKMTPKQIAELAAAGWEVGSHSMTHQDFSADGANLYYEVVESRRLLESEIGVPVDTFAYPYGAYSLSAIHLVSLNYSTGMGLGLTANQSENWLYYLRRRAVLYDWDIDTFGSYLPWQLLPTP